MKERPIIFSAEEVRAVLAGRKTSTRRIVRGVLPPLTLTRAISHELLVSRQGSVPDHIRELEDELRLELVRAARVAGRETPGSAIVIVSPPLWSQQPLSYSYAYEAEARVHLLEGWDDSLLVEEAVAWLDENVTFAPPPLGGAWREASEGIWVWLGPSEDTRNEEGDAPVFRMTIVGGEQP